MKNLIILGRSRSGKDTIARTLGWDNRKFSQFAKDFVDRVFGGNFEQDRNTVIANGKTKLDLLIELYHVFKPYNASVYWASIHWDFPPSKPTCYTDVRTLPELHFLARHYPDVLVLPHGETLESDSEFLNILEVALSYDLHTVYWQHDHPASYKEQTLVQLLGELGYDSNRYRTQPFGRHL